MKIVLDTNVLISGLISRTSPPAELIEAWQNKHVTLVTSREQIQELKRVLSYSKIKKYIHPNQAKILIETMLATADLAPNTLPKIDLSPDPDDNLIIATAIAGEVDILVSGDKSDLVALSEVQGIPICTPRNAIKKIQKG